MRLLGTRTMQMRVQTTGIMAEDDEKHNNNALEFVKHNYNPN